MKVALGRILFGIMLTTLLFVAALAPTTVRLTPTDDLWVYPHASDPQKDAYLRVWGVEDRAVAEDPSDAGNFSYSYLQWDVSSIPAGAKVSGAKLILVHVSDPKYTEHLAQKAPLQARPVIGAFTEKTWSYADSAKVYPAAEEKSVFGSASPSPWPKAGEEFKLTLDLLKGPNDFSKYLAASLAAKKPLALALTTKLEVNAVEGVQALYKVYSKDSPASLTRPALEVTYTTE